MTLLDLLTRALLGINAFRPGETLPADATTDAKNELNVMVDSLNIGAIYSSSRETKTLTIGTANYTWGTGGTINTARPVKLTGVSIADGDNNYPVSQISESEYDTISDRTITGKPFQLYYNPTYPLGNIYLFYIPDKAYVLHLSSEKDLAEFSTLTETINLPAEYFQPLIDNLSLRLCGPYEKTPTALLIENAKEGLMRLKRLNASNKLKPVKMNQFPSSSLGGHWKAGNITTGERY